MMNMQSVISLPFTVLCFFTLSSTAFAQPQVNCKSPYTQFEMNVCAAQQAGDADRVLNQVYPQVIAKYKGTAQEDRLIDAQISWIKFRDLECTFAKKRFEGGSIAPMVYSNCLKRLTIQRTQGLKVYLTEGSF